MTKKLDSAIKERKPLGERLDPAFKWLQRQSTPPAEPSPRSSWRGRIKALALPAAAAFIASSLLWVMTTETAWYYGEHQAAETAAQAGAATYGWQAKGFLVTRVEFVWLLSKHALLISFLAWFALTGRGARFRGWLSKRIKARPPAAGWRAKLPQRFRDSFRLRAVYIIIASLSYCLYAFMFDSILYTVKVYFDSTHESVAAWMLRHLLEEVAGFTLLAGAGFLFYFFTGLFYRHWLWLAGITIPLLLFIGLQVMPDFKHFYNRTTPLRDKGKENLILKFAEGEGVEVDIKEIDASRQSKAVNARSTGHIPERPAKPHVNIVYTDTLLDGFTDTEILFVTGHELGHHALIENDEAKTMRNIVAVCLIIVGFFVADRVCKTLIGKYHARLGFTDINDPASIPLVALTVSVLCFAYVPIGNAMTLYQERYADWCAARLVVSDESSRAAAASAFEKLGAASPHDPNPPLVIQLLLEDHPSVGERLKFIKSFDGGRAGRRPPRHSLLPRMDQ